MRWPRALRALAMTPVVALLAIRSSGPIHAAWIPPVGIPAPSFGIEETVDMYVLGPGEDCSTHPDKCFDFGSGLVPYPISFVSGKPYSHYVNTAGCSNSATFGTPDTPRCRIPDTLPAGSVVEVHGGRYTYGNFNGGGELGIYAQGTPARPVFVRGVSKSVRPTIQRVVRVRGHYLIVENILFDKNRTATAAVTLRWADNATIPEGRYHHIAVRHCEAKNASLTAGPGSMFGASGAPDHDVEDLVWYDNLIHPDDFWVLVEAPEFREKDTVGIGIANNTNRVWIVDNHIYGGGGDSIGAGHGDNYTSRNYYIGRNDIHDNGENAIDLKEVENIVVSQNVMHDLYGYSAGSDGSIGVVHYGPQFSPRNTWFLFNEIYNANGTGIQVGGASVHESYYIGNIFHDITNEDGDGRAFYCRNSWPGHLVGNVFYNNDRHLVTGPAVSGNMMIHNNIFGDINNPATGYHVDHEAAATGNNADMSNNILFQSNGSVRVDWGTSTRSDIPSAECTNCLYVDPQFVDPAALDFRLQAGSPARDAGVLSSLYALYQSRFGVSLEFDFNGIPRPQGGTWDIGAHEYHSGVASQHPRGTTPLQIIGFAIGTINETSALVTWRTPRPASSRLHYGRLIAAPSHEVTDGVLRTQHAVTLTNLTPGSRYYVRLSGQDAGGASGTAGPLPFNTTGSATGGGPNEGESGSGPSLIVRRNIVKPSLQEFFEADVETSRSTSIKFELFDRRGKLVRALFDGVVSGSRTVVWDGRDDEGVLAASGIYTLIIKMGDAETIKKVVVLK